MTLAELKAEYQETLERLRKLRLKASIPIARYGQTPRRFQHRSLVEELAIEIVDTEDYLTELALQIIEKERAE